jgi:PAS domain S-box-containing protein
MRESEERFRKIFENAAMGIAISDWQGHFEQCNPAYCALLGYTEQELHQIDFASLVHPEDREANLAVLRRLRKGEVPSFEIENRYVHRDGQQIWVRKFVSVLSDETGNPTHFLALVKDITERKRAAAALRESEEKLRLFIENAPVALAMFDHKMRYLAVSRRWLADYYLGDAEIIGRSHYEVFPEIPERWREVHRRGLAGELVRADEDSFTRADGTVLWRRWEVGPWKQADGTIGGIVIFTEDISARRRAEEALARSEERFRLMADHAPVMIWMSGSDKLCTWFNKPWLAFVGRPLAQELGNGWTENAHPGDFDRCLQTYRTAFDARRSFTMEYRLKRHDGEYRWVLDSGIPVYAASGEFTGYIGSCIDITGRKRAETELLLQAQVAANLAEGVCLVRTGDGLLVYTNDRFEKMFGYDPGELLGRHVSVLNAVEGPRPAALVEEIFRALRAQGVWKGELANAKKDGTLFWCHASVSKYEHSEYGTVWVAAYTDITDRESAETALRVSEERLQAILNTATDAIITIDYHGIIQSVNPATEQMFGYAAHEMIGHNATMLMTSRHREVHDNYIARYLQTGDKHILDTTREVEARRKDGSVFPTDLTVSEIKHLKLFTGTHRDLTRRKELEREVVEIASEEQQRIGRELHDEIGQELTGLGMLADALVRQMGGKTETQRQLAGKLADGLQQVHQRVRTLCRDLVLTGMDGQGLRTALSNLAERTRDQTGIECTIDCPESIPTPSPITANHLYRIAQEALSNAVRHGRPAHVRIELHPTPRGLKLCVQDDGSGLPNGGGYTWESRGLGLSTMRYRANLIGGSLHITPADGKGVRVVCIAPWENDDAEG